MDDRSQRAFLRVMKSMGREVRDYNDPPRKDDTMPKKNKTVYVNGEYQLNKLQVLQVLETEGLDVVDARLYPIEVGAISSSLMWICVLKDRSVYRVDWNGAFRQLHSVV